MSADAVNNAYSGYNKSNSDLSKEELQAKKQRKRRLKQQARKTKYEVRLQRAIKRGDVQVAERTRAELLEHVQSMGEEDCHSVNDDSCSMNKHADAALHTTKVCAPIQQTKSESQVQTWSTMDGCIEDQDAHKYAASIYRRLQYLLLHDNTRSKSELDHTNNSSGNGESDSAGEKYNKWQNANSHARNLLQHMTKGTQTLHMFGNSDALYGYTRHKFVSRAALIVKSCLHLEHMANRASSLDTDHTRFEDSNSTVRVLDDAKSAHAERVNKAYNALTKVNTLVSIGCGPGCDAVGFLAYIRKRMKPSDVSAQQVEKTEETASKSANSSDTALDDSDSSCITSLVLLDWAMPQWRDAVLNQLTGILIDEARLVKNVRTASCDVRQSIYDNVNAEALQYIQHGDTLDVNYTTSVRRDHRDACQDITKNRDFHNERPHYLYILSYLLAETRDKWTVFFADLIEQSSSGTLYLLSDPTAWQLHIFRKKYEHMLDYIWLDSSMHEAELQALDNRVGPAVLLCIKR